MLQHGIIIWHLVSISSVITSLSISLHAELSKYFLYAHSQATSNSKREQGMFPSGTSSFLRYKKVIMKFIKSIFIFLIFIAVAAEMPAQVSTPRIRTQGTLKDAAGAALPNGTRSITFKLFNVSGGGTALWEETANVTISGGIYTHLLGSVNPLNPAIFNQTLFIGRFMNGKELLPRSEMSASPYALYVKEASNGLATGTVIAFAGATPPAGWLLCNGQALSSSDYPALYSTLGTTYGNGSTGINAGGDKQFNVPDLRGEFVRGLDEGRGIDAGRQLGTVQGPSAKLPPSSSSQFRLKGNASSNTGHTHSMAFEGTNDGPGHTHTSTQLLAPGYNQFTGTFSVNTTGATNHIHTGTVTGGGDAETRPRNVSMNYLIKI